MYVHKVYDFIKKITDFVTLRASYVLFIKLLKVVDFLGVGHMFDCVSYCSIVHSLC